MPLVLVVEDDETIVLSFKSLLKNKGYDFISASDGKTGLALALRELPDVVFLDIRLPDINGIGVLQAIKAEHPEMAVAMMTGYGEIKDAVEAMKAGAEHYFQKPLDIDEILVTIEKCMTVTRLRNQVMFLRKPPYPIYGISKHVQGLFHLIRLLAENTSTTVLITGQTGTGKELVARNIHALSARSEKPFMEINCAAIPEGILESELFGHEVGAFTDAKRSKKGLFEHADGGTVFLDEIGDMPPGAQSKLLRALESRKIRRLGSTREITVDVRVLAATNKDLREEVRGGAFREDLYFRINVMPVHVQPLRERAEDICVIAEFFLKEFSFVSGKTAVTGFTEEAMSALLSYDWPGNVRELKNVIERAVILSKGRLIGEEDLLLPSGGGAVRHPIAMEDVEKKHIQWVLALTGGNKKKAAGMLGIARSTLNEKLKHYGIT